MSNLSIKSRLLIMLLSVSAISIALVASLTYSRSYDALRESVFSHLTSVRAAKADQIEQYIESIRDEAHVLGSAAGVGMAALEFSRAYKELEDVELEPEQLLELENYYREDFLPKLNAMVEGTPEFGSLFPESNAARYLQYHYIANNPYPTGDKQQLDKADDDSAYTRIHAKQHPVLRRIVNGFGYYDFFLIDIETGVIVYSTAKEIDFGRNLIAGPHAYGNLAELFRKVQRMPDRGGVHFIDFAHYRPSHGAPAAFVAVPIFSGAKPVAVIAVQVSTTELDRVMTGGGQWERDGLGQTGETILIGPDYTMRSASRFLIEDPEMYAASLRVAATPEAEIQRMLSNGSPILEQEVRTVAAEQALRGQSGTGVITDYRGVEILGSWAPLRLQELDWAIVGKIDLSEAYAPIYDLAKETLIQTVIIMAVITIVVMLLANSFVRPVNDLISRVRRAGSGDVDVQFDGESNDEIGDLSRSFSELVDSVRKQTSLIDEVSQENQRLLENMLPRRMAQRVRLGDEELIETVDDVSVLFVELHGLVELTYQRSAEESIEFLKEFIATTDATASRHGVERIKTMGDTYMGAVGLSAPLLDHMRRAVEFARDVQGDIARISAIRELDLSVTIGIAAGTVITDVAHNQEVLFQLWGEAVIQADYARDRAGHGEILVTQSVRDQLSDSYNFQRVDDTERVALWTLTDG
jgi:class 3 adenylate cyclase